MKRKKKRARWGLVALAASLWTPLASIGWASDASPSNSTAPSRTVGEIRQGAESGDAEAQYLLGLLYTTGEGLPRSPEQARNWLRKAAEQGDPRAQNCLGLLLDPTWFGATGADEAKRAERAHEAALWYTRAASQGFLPAAHNLQVMKDRKLVADDIPDPLPLERASLASKQEPSLTARFSGEADLADGKDARTVFAEIAPAAAEVVGDGNYGSGVLLGTLTGKDGKYELARGALSAPKSVPYAFFSRSQKEPVTLEGTFSAVLTNRHVLQGNVQVTVGLGSNENGETKVRFPMRAVCLADDTGLDLALMLVPHDKGSAEALRALRPVEPYDEAKAPPKGSVVFALGNPEKLARTITQGLFNGVRPEGLQFDAPISKGSSGGALIDAQGRLLGLIVGFASAEGSQNLNFAIPYDVLAKFLSGEGMHCFVP
ncbi:MAG: trypsin-like peptidase domain-containing protein [Silvanigrellales bacterium]|nr:trypsin-like peptidase domain-containing protein [Silvanigrellales bacterium]